MRLNIITIHLNDFGGLRQTLESLQRILPQRDIEWILVDGGSNGQRREDGALLEEAAAAANLFVTEPDDGIYDAMNKGTARSTGEYVLYLNAGDELHPEFNWGAVIEQMGKQEPAMIWGTCHERFANSTLVKVKNRSPSFAWYGMPVNHQNVLFRRNLLGVTPYDLHYKICADYDLVSRILKQGGKVLRTSIPFAIFQRGGANEQRLTVTMEEEAKLRTLHYGVPPVVSQGIKRLKGLNARLGQVPALRRLMRKWV